MTIFVRGIGWLSSEGYGCVRVGRQHSYRNGEGVHALSKQETFSYPFKNFGRLDELSRKTAYAVALALQDAGIEYGLDVKQDIGIIGTSREGSLRTDIDYFKDYINSGRTLSRGNLFIYTLPSSPLGEAAIHFGLRGPLLYLADENASVGAVLDVAEDMIIAGETSVVLAGRAEEDHGVFFVLERGPQPAGGVLCDLPRAREIANKNNNISTLVRAFAALA